MLRHVNYIYAPTGLVAAYEQTPTNAKMHYIYTDYLGSLRCITDEAGTVEQQLSYDAWGKRRNANTGAPLINTPTNLIFARGYTGHEHLDEFGLINMNGRIYDPTLALFLSVDPYVQAPDNTQNFNRYAYCVNNPMMYTDPSGEFVHLIIGAAIGGLMNWAMSGAEFSWKGLGSFAIGALAGAAGAGVGVGIQTASAGASFWAGFVGSSQGISTILSVGYASSFANGFISGAGAGFSSGLISGTGNGLLNGQNFGQALSNGFKSATFGGLTGGITNGISEGISAIRNKANFWDGSTKENFYISNDKNKLPFVKDYAKYSELDNLNLNDKMLSLNNTKVGDHSIDLITTNPPPSYNVNTAMHYVDNNGNLIGGVCHHLKGPKGFTNIHISPYVTRSDDILFMAVSRHEILHAYHHYTLGYYFDKILSESACYQYTRNFLNINGRYREALNYFISSNTDYWNTFPSQYSFPSHIIFKR